MGALDRLTDRLLGQRAFWRAFDVATDAHVLAYRATRGAVGHGGRLGVPPMLLLDHVGAKSGRRRTTPLAYARDGSAYAVVASKGGHPRHPAWYHNLRANPDTTIQVGSRRLPVRARVAEPGERERLWKKALDVWPGYDGYQRRTEREIPVVVLEPR